MIGLLVLAVACFGKFTGLTRCPLRWLNSLGRFGNGSGMNARGAMEIIDHRSLVGVLNQQMYLIVMVAIVTSLMAPPLLRWTLSKVEIGEEEAHRLQQEEQASRSFIKTSTVCLCPLGGANVQLAASQPHGPPNDMEVTALSRSVTRSPSTGRPTLQTLRTVAEEAIASGRRDAATCRHDTADPDRIWTQQSRGHSHRSQQGAMTC